MIISILYTISVLLISTGLSILWGKVSRMCGGGKPKLPWGLDQLIYAIPFGLAAGLIVPNTYLGYFLMFISYVSAVIGKRMGHGQYFDLGGWIRKVKTESVDFIVRLFYGKDINTIEDGVPGNPDRDLFGLSLTGLVCGLGLSITLFYTGYYFYAVLLIISSVLKGHIYKQYKDNPEKQFEFFGIGVKMDEPNSYTEKGEWETGVAGTCVPWILTIGGLATLIGGLLDATSF